MSEMHLDELILEPIETDWEARDRQYREEQQKRNDTYTADNLRNAENYLAQCIAYETDGRRDPSMLRIFTNALEAIQGCTKVHSARLT